MEEGGPEDGSFSLILETIPWGGCGVSADLTEFPHMCGDSVWWKPALGAVK